MPCKLSLLNCPDIYATPPLTAYHPLTATHIPPTP
uniref:Uncharacterized protein n=1 Tax=Siphoviridae sp. ctLfk13 TaxID=2826251 RepID=A0A8S5N2C0_9CAUD|nr:MAG TPA: hypothetical protein [Siphoviridae sp. ctLfk13]